MNKYLNIEKLKTLLSELKEEHKQYKGDFHEGVVFAVNEIVDDIEESINSLQQEPTPDTDTLHTELVNLLKIYRIGEETARTMANRIADTYGSQRYMDGLCDGLKQEQPEVDLGETVEFECIGKKIKMTVRELINYYIDSECVDVAEECGF